MAEQLQPWHPACAHRHRPDLPCWKGAYRKARRHEVLRSQPSCARCRRPATTVDHEVARAWGGDDSYPGNLLPMCGPCNQAKGAGPLTYPAEPATQPSGIGLSPRWR